MISREEDRDGVEPKIKRLVLSSEIHIILRRNAQSGSKRKKGGQKKENNKRGKEKEREDHRCLRVWAKKKWSQET